MSDLNTIEVVLVAIHELGDGRRNVVEHVIDKRSTAPLAHQLGRAYGLTHLEPPDTTCREATKWLVENCETGKKYYYMLRPIVD